MRLPPLPKEYSATLVRSDGHRSRIYLRRDRRRVETRFADGRRHVVIARGDLGLGWLRQNEDPWLETPLSWRTISGEVDPSIALSWKGSGHADVDGAMCTRYQGFAGETMQEECFILPSGIRRRTITYRADGTVALLVDCLDVVIGPPALGLFEPPEQAKVSLPGLGSTKQHRPKLNVRSTDAAA